eukprot:SAG31_NODE_433_length_15750_cov_6.132579_10_plen_86_part_00
MSEVLVAHVGSDEIDRMCVEHGGRNRVVVGVMKRVYLLEQVRVCVQTPMGGLTRQCTQTRKSGAVREVFLSQCPSMPHPEDSVID